MGTDSIIYIRTDANAKIATGHLVRCLCIAQALEELGRKVCFLVSDDTSFSLLKDLRASIFHDVSFSFDTKILESAVYDDLELEIDELCGLLVDNKSVILIDSYYVTPRYFETLKPHAYVAYMDDLRSFDYDVDLVINYDVIPPSKEEEYKQTYTKAKTALLGAQYTPLRKQFQNQKVELKDEVKNILITTGGSDPYHFAEGMSSFLASQNLDADIHIAVGKLFDNIETLKILASKYPRIHLHQNVTDMATLMKQCDYAISAAGTTLYELCALGIPTVSITMADNQVIIAETFDETGAVPYAGDIRNTPPSVLEMIKEHLTYSIKNTNAYKQQRHLMQQVTKGNGAILIAQKLYKLYSNIL